MSRGAASHGDADRALRDGLARQAAGDLKGAEALFARAVAGAPDDPRALALLGLARLRAGRAAEALAPLERLAAVAPERADHHYFLGRALRAVGRPADAEACLRNALAADPDHVGARTRMGALVSERGDADGAAAHLERAVALAPKDPEARYLLALAREAQGRVEEALTNLRAVTQMVPGHPQAHYHLGRLAMDEGAFLDAADHFRRAARAAPDRAAPHVELGLALTRVGALEEAARALDRALALDPVHERALAARANVLVHQGDVDAAWALLRPRIEGPRPGPDVVSVFAELAPRLGRADEALGLLEARLRDGDLSPNGRSLLHFRAGSLCDRAREYDRAFAHFSEGNTLRRRPFDRAAHAAAIDDLIRVFGAEAMRHLPRATNAYPLPIFVVGMPRSGTTLVEQILASHPKVFGAGERSEIGVYAGCLPAMLGGSAPYPACVADVDRGTLDTLAEGYHALLSGLAPGADRVTDKMPQNFLNLGLIALLLPGSRVIHVVRDPRDTCLSCHFQAFSGHSYAEDLADLGFYYREYERLMAHWRAVLPIPMLEVRYEDLVADQEARSREIIAFAGLDWDARCLRFHETERVVATASRDQVRRPMYSGSVGRWRHYERHLEPLFAALAGEG